MCNLNFEHKFNEHSALSSLMSQRSALRVRPAPSYKTLQRNCSMMFVLTQSPPPKCGSEPAICMCYSWILLSLYSSSLTTEKGGAAPCMTWMRLQSHLGTRLQSPLLVTWRWLSATESIYSAPAHGVNKLFSFRGWTS